MSALRPLVLACLVAAASSAFAPAARAEGPSARDGHVVAELVSETTTTAAGATLSLGVLFRSDPQWHVYWKNVGDSGTVPTVKWTLPEGATAGPIQWPAPKRLVIEGLAVFVYEGEVLLPVEVKLPATLTGEAATIRADVEWLVCRDQECEPGFATLTLALPVRDAIPVVDPTRGARFAAARAALPVPLAAGVSRSTREANAFTLRLVGAGSWTDAAAGLEFFPEADILANAEPQRLVRADGVVALVLPEKKDLRTWPANLRGTLIVTAGTTRAVYDVDAPIEPAGKEAWLQASFRSDGGEAGDSSMSTWSALLLAFLGGIFLNLMPCVLPVLSLKVLGFVERAGDAPALVRRHGLVYGAGVMAAFGALAAILLVLRAGGEGVGWGFQLQDPRFVAALCLVMAGMGASLLGAVELGAGLARVGALGDSLSGYGASFLGGALATVVATPCTGPFMGPALGFALTRPPAEAVGIILSLGAGMAAPYVLLAAFPGWLRAVPRPGPWMDTLKRAMSFPLLATAVWLAWVLGQQRGVDGMLVLLLASLVLCAGLWVLGHFGAVHRSAAVRWTVGRGLGLVLGAAAAYGAFLAAKPAAPPLVWEPWSDERVAAARAEGHPVLVDFTADWCLTCKVNEKTTLSSDAVRESVARTGAVLLQADWTKKDARIAAALARFGRASVPLYVVYGTTPGSLPVVLETAPFLSVDGVTRALEGAKDAGPAAGSSRSP